MQWQLRSASCAARNLSEMFEAAARPAVHVAACPAGGGNIDPWRSDTRSGCASHRSIMHPLQPAGPFQQLANLCFFLSALVSDVLLIRLFLCGSYIWLFTGEPPSCKGSAEPPFCSPVCCCHVSVYASAHWDDLRRRGHRTRPHPAPFGSPQPCSRAAGDAQMAFRVAHRQHSH